MKMADHKRDLYDERLNRISYELNILKDMVQKISSEVKDNDSKLPKQLEKYKHKLIENGVDYSIATSILKDLMNKSSFEDKDRLKIKTILQ